MDELQKECIYCREIIKQSAKVCYHCGRHQVKLIQYFDRVGIVISVLLLILSFWQATETRMKRIEADEALKRAQAAETQIREGSKVMAKVFLAMSNMDGTITGLDVAQFFPGIMKREAEALLNTIHATTDEQEDVYRINNLIKEWAALYREQSLGRPKSVKIRDLEQQIRKLSESK